MLFVPYFRLMQPLLTYPESKRIFKKKKNFKHFITIHLTYCNSNECRGKVWHNIIVVGRSKAALQNCEK